MSDKKQCFVIAPIGESESETRKRSDKVLKYVIRPAVESCGYFAERADEMDKPGMITSQVIQRIVNDALVVADLTERNPNVFYEIAIRHAIRKPLVQIIKKGERLPFDVANTRTIQVDHQDLDSVESAKNAIIQQVKSLEKDSSDLETPISVSLDLQVLRQSDKPEERSLADLLAAVSDLGSGLAKVEAKLGAPDARTVVEEFQLLIQSLHSRLGEYFETGFNRRCDRFHPMLVRDLLHTSIHEGNREMGLLVAASMLRNQAPWLAEAALEVYRATKNGRSKATIETFSDFRRLVNLTMQGPFRELLGRSKDILIIVEELDSLLHEIMHEDGLTRRRRVAGESDV